MAIQYWSLDFFIILFYLFMILYVGIIAGKDLTNFREFAISKKNFSTPTVVATIFATAVGGGTTLGLAEKSFSVGVIYLLPSIGNFIGYIIFAYIILYSKILHNHDNLSVGELVGRIYGKAAQIITGVFAISVSLGYVSAQISGIGYIFNYFFDTPFIWGVVLGYSIVITYTTFGGIRSVVFTDVIQFGVMVIAIPLLFKIGINEIGGVSNLIASVPIENLSFISDKMSFIELVILCITFSFIGLNPSFIQRLLIVKNRKQAFNSIICSASMLIPFFILVTGIGLISLSMNSNINPNFAFPYLVDHILPVGLKGMLIAGLLSAIMSTADSDLNIIGISAVNDVFVPLSNKKLSEGKVVTLARVITFVFGLLSILIPLYFKNIIDIILFFTNFWAPTLFIPLIMAFLGKKVSSFSFFVSLCCGVISMLLYNYYTDAKYGAGPVVGVGMNLIMFIICYVIEGQNINPLKHSKRGTNVY